MASRSFAAFHHGGRRTLDVPVAALAGLSIAVVAFAMPANLLADLVSATGLPSIVSAAEPPLGFKARIGLGAAGAVLVFAATFLLLRWLEKFGSGRAARKAEQEDELTLEVEAPRLRRRDIHPDAPARPPLLAAHELGEPDFGFEERYSAWPSSPAKPAATGLSPSPDPWPAPEVLDDPEPTERAEPASEQAFEAPISGADRQAEAFALSQSRWTDMDSPERAPEPVDRQPWLAEPPGAPELGDADSPLPPEQPWTAFEPEPEPAAEAKLEPEAEVEPEPEPEPEQWIAAANPWSPPEPAAERLEEPAERPQPGSIPDLMARLEQGLARRRGPEPPVSSPAEPPAPAFPPADNDRLQNAIDSLQRFASRQD